MYLSDYLLTKLTNAESRKDALYFIIEDCFLPEQQDAAMEWCEQHRPDLKL